MSNKEIDKKCSIADCKQNENGKCALLENAEKYFQEGIWTPTDVSIAKNWFDLAAKFSGCQVSENFKAKISDIVPKEVVKDKPKIR